MKADDGTGDDFSDPQTKDETFGGAPASDPSAPDPNSPAELARLNSIYGSQGSVYSPPSLGATWDPQTETYNSSATTGASTPPAQSTASTDTTTPPAASIAAPPPAAPPAAAAGVSSGTDAMTNTQQSATTPPTPPTVNDPTANAGTDAFSQSIRDALLKELGQGPVSADDPTIAPAIAANRVATERGLADQRNQIAERLNAQGMGNSGSLDTQMQAARERATTGEAQFSGNAVMQQAQSRRQELVNLLQTGAGVMNADQSRQLQGKIADLDAFLRQQGITNQNQQFYDQLGMSAAQFEQLMNEQAVRDSMGG